MRTAWLLVPLLAGCTAQRAPQPAATSGSLEAAAIAAGVVDDPTTTDPTGLYARDNDRLCLVPAGGAFRAGVYIDYDRDQYCTGTGAATRAGEAIHFAFSGDPGCSFDARFEGDRIVFPADLPPGCSQLCTEKASLTALNVGRLSGSLSEAGAMRDGKGRLLCGRVN